MISEKSGLKVTDEPLYRSNEGSILIGVLKGFNLNSVADQPIILNGGTLFVVTDVLATNVSGALTTVATTQIWSAAAKTGSNVWQLTGPTVRNLVDPSDILCNAVGGLQIFTYPFYPYKSVGNTVYASNGTAEGAPATLDLYVYGYVLQ